jgi:two-component system phosphate regulon sensor histidine kinase PhoR
MAVRTRRERVLTFFFVPALVFAVVVLLGVTFRNSFQLEKLREQSVVEATLTLANEKADRLDKRIIEQDNAVLSLVDVADRDTFGQQWLTVATRQTPPSATCLLDRPRLEDREVAWPRASLRRPSDAGCSYAS